MTKPLSPANVRQNLRVADRYEQRAITQALLILEAKARKVLVTHPNLQHFTMAMGSAFFTKRNGDTFSVSHPDHKTPGYAQAVIAFLDEFNERLHLTGEPMTFTATGPKMSDWPCTTITGA